MISSPPDHSRPARYEYRVWGKYPKARDLIRELADSETREEVDDCYLIVDDLDYNAKIRDNRLKTKQLVSEAKGFEEWTSKTHRTSDSVPAPLESIYEALKLDRLRSKKRFSLEDALKGLDDHDGVRAVQVTKRRRRYVLGDMKAEVTDVEIHTTGEVVRTISIEGGDLRDLVKLRKTLGLKGESNTAVHQYIDDEFSS